MTADELRRAEEAYQRAQGAADAARLERNALVLDALAAGWSQSSIARATGLSAARVGQLAKALGRRVFVAHDDIVS